METKNYLILRDVLLKSLRNRGVKAPARKYSALTNPVEQIDQIQAMRAERDAIDHQMIEDRKQRRWSR